MKSTALDKLSLALRLIVAAVFLYTGWQKAGATEQFADRIAAYQLLPSQLINIFALALPPLELIIGFLLLIGWQRRVATFSALILTGVFVIALGSAIVRGLNIDCGCFGARNAGKSDLLTALLRDLSLIIALLFVYSREIRAAADQPDSASPNENILSKSGKAQA